MNPLHKLLQVSKNFVSICIITIIIIITQQVYSDLYHTVFVFAVQMIKRIESSLENTKLQFALIDAKTDWLFAKFERFSSIIEPKIVTASEQLQCITQDIQGLKSCQDMMYIKQDHIQSTLADEPSHYQNLQSSSKDTAVAYARNPGLSSPPVSHHSRFVCPTPNLTVTPGIYQAGPSTGNLTQPTIDLTDIDLPYFEGQSHFNLPSDIRTDISDEGIQSFLSMNWDPKPPQSTTQSDPGVYPMSSKMVSSSKTSQSLVPERVYSDSLLEPEHVVKQLATNVTLETVGRLGVSLARFSFFGDDILHVSTLKGRGKKHLALNPHTLEALNAFIHQLEPFKCLSKDDFDINVKTKVETALKDHLKSPVNRSPVQKYN